MAKIVKSHTVSEIIRLPSVDDDGNLDFENPTDGICAFYVRKDIESMWSKTNGINHGIDNTGGIEKIEEWQQKYDLVLWGCGRDWLHLFFIHEEPTYNFQLGASNEKYFREHKLWKERTPRFKDFAKEVAEFCPDTITQIYGSKTKLINAMKELNGVYLWWD